MAVAWCLWYDWAMELVIILKLEFVVSQTAVEGGMSLFKRGQCRGRHVSGWMC